MTNTDLLRHIRRGDLTSLDFSRLLFSGDRVVDPTRTKVANQLAAFANGCGGTLALGVDEETPQSSVFHSCGWTPRKTG